MLSILGWLSLLALNSYFALTTEALPALVSAFFAGVSFVCMMEKVADYLTGDNART